MVVRAVIFDFNGTLSNDEPILCKIFRDLFAEQGKPLSAEEYFDQLAGLSDPEIVRTWLGPAHSAVDQVIAERTARYRAAVSGGSTVSETVREAVRYAAARVPVAIVSGAARAEIDPVLTAAELSSVIQAVVSADDISEGKPNPESYVRALELLDEGIRAGEVVVFEDTEAGIASAQAAGMRCIAVLGTLRPERLAAADDVVPAIDVALMRQLLGGLG